MPNADDIKTSIAENAAAGVSEVEVDGTRVKAMPIDDQIAAEKHLRSDTAASKPGRGMRFTQLIPGPTI